MNSRFLLAVAVEYPAYLLVRETLLFYQCQSSSPSFFLFSFPLFIFSLLTFAFFQMKLVHVIVSLYHHWAKTTFCLRLMKARHHPALVQRSSISNTVPCLLRVTSVTPEQHQELFLMGRFAWLLRGVQAAALLLQHTPDRHPMWHREETAHSESCAQ